MKRFLLVAVLVLFAMAAQCQTVIVVDNATLQWDAVTQLSDNSALPAGSTLEYEVYRDTIPLLNPDLPAAHTLLGTTAATSMAITIPAVAGQYTYGVRAKLTDGVSVLFSPLVWSSVAGTPSPFVYRRPGTVPPRHPANLRNQ